MDNLEVRLAYQKESGLCLDTINAIACIGNHGVSDYILWLENKVSEGNKN